MTPFAPIGILHTVFKEKFGVPRQSSMMSEARGVLKLGPDPRYHAALGLLETFSHVWIVFVFDQNATEDWHPVIDPPTDEPVKGVGVFASRSPHRPNPIGLSAVKLEKIDYEAPGGIEIHLSGVDILDGTAVLDIKPYLPFTDRIEDANGGWTAAHDPIYPVVFSSESLSVLDKLENPVKGLITQMLERDPRPTSQRRAFPMLEAESQGKAFAFRVQGMDIHWRIQDCAPYVVSLKKLS